MRPAAFQASAPSSFWRYAITGYVSIVAVFGGFGMWAAMAPLDSAAIAPARVAVETDRKPIQHLEGGIIREILVMEAQRVEQGQLLFRLQPVQAQANTDLLKKQLDGAVALEARLLAEQQDAPSIAFPEAVLARSSIPETANAMADQQRQFAERHRSLENQIGLFQTKIDQTAKDIAGRTQRQASLRAQEESYRAEIGKVTPLADRGYYPTNKLMALERERTRIQGELGFTNGEIERLKEAIAEWGLQIRQARQKRLEEVTQQLGETRLKVSDIREKLVIAQDVLTRVDVRAPRSGVVQGIKVHAIGAVVKPGDTLAELIPMGDSLIMAARVSPLDIESVTVGQRAEVRFPAFPPRQTPLILGHVESISADSLVDELTKDRYYLARIVIDPGMIPAPLAKRLVPGMPADVLISRGERTLLEYLLEPLVNAVAKSMREK